MKIVAIIQARMGSNRLPGKVLADVCGKPLLHYVVSRVRQARTLSLFAVATSDHATDDVIEKFCQINGVPSFRGSEDDVLDRYYRAAKYFQANVIVRLTADCPLLDPAIIDKVIETFMTGKFDYCSNAQEPSYPDGFDTEVFTWDALERSWQEAHLPSEREHVSTYIIKNPGLFRLGSVKHDQDLSRLRWTVDEPRDLDLIREIYRHLPNKESFRLDDLLALYREHPELSAINSGIDRNEGYRKSLQRDTFKILEEKP
jgi:spore coat polysaccharide biosynthesis protein SpsF